MKHQLIGPRNTKLVGLSGIKIFLRNHQRIHPVYSPYLLGRSPGSTDITKRTFKSDIYKWTRHGNQHVIEKKSNFNSGSYTGAPLCSASRLLSIQVWQDGPVFKIRQYGIFQFPLHCSRYRVFTTIVSIIGSI